MAASSSSIASMGFLLVASQEGQKVYYSGRAGPAWVDPCRLEAFIMSEEYAAHKAALFNRRSALHGLKFEMEAQ